MEEYLWIFIIIGVAVIWVIISWSIATISNSKRYLERKPKLDNLERAIEKHEAQITNDKIKLEAESKERLDGFSQKVKKTKDEFDLREKLWNEQIQKDKDEIQKLAKQKSMGFPWLAEAYADHFALKDEEIENI